MEISKFSDNLSSLGAWEGIGLGLGGGAGVTLPGPRAAVSLLDGALAWLGPAPHVLASEVATSAKSGGLSIHGADAAR